MAAADGAGFYCSTSGTTFTDKEALAEHYRSDFHRYNLKRKVANLPPVTREWFEARKGQLRDSLGTTAVRTWVDPLTRKIFNSENTYLAHVNSKKYKDAVRQSGQAPPPPIVTLRRLKGDGESRPLPAAPQPSPAYHAAAPNGVARPVEARRGEEEAVAPSRAESAGKEDDSASSGWETVSEEGERDGAMDHELEPAGPGLESWSEWDPCISLFDLHASKDMAANLEYMWQRFGFYFPDAESLVDAEGLLKYLGAKLAHGHIPLYVRGDDPDPRQFASLHAVQRHMADTGRFKLAWEGNEPEYSDFYDFGPPCVEEGDRGMEVAVADGGEEYMGALRTGGYELAVGGAGAGGRKLLGSREFARYYRQRHRPADPRASVAAGAIVAQYRALGIATSEGPDRGTKRAQAVEKRMHRLQLATQLRANVTRDLPRNVPY